MVQAVRKRRKRRRKVVVLWKRVRGVMFHAYPMPGKETSDDPRDWISSRRPYILGDDGVKYLVSDTEETKFILNRPLNLRPTAGEMLELSMMEEIR